MHEYFAHGFIKRAQELGLTPKEADDLFKNHQLQHQQYMGLSPRREFSQSEQTMVDDRKSAILPKIFQSLKDSPAEKMYSPGTDATWKGGLGALGGGLLGSLFSGGDGNNNMPAILGALLGGGAMGAIGYHGRKAKNEDIEETMHHLPENATQRHYYADPLVQKGKDRDHAEMIAKLRQR